MTTLTTTKPVIGLQLALEMGGVPLSVSTEGDVTTIVAPDSVSAAVLQAAVDAHVAVDHEGNRRTLEEQATSALATNRTFLDRASPTNAQVVAQVKALTRQNNGLIRLVLNRLDGTD